MLIRRPVSVFLCAVGLWCPAPAQAHELSDRAAIQAEVYYALHRADYAALESFAELYRSTQARTASGLWKLTIFYTGVEAAFDADNGDKSHWDRIEDAAARWVERDPASPTARLAYAQMLRSRAWHHRGTGYSYTVEPEGWRPFHEDMEKARQYLEEHKGIAAKDPHWYEMMAEIAAVQDWPEERFADMLAEGQKTAPGFYQLYFAAMDYYAPKWGGSAAKIEQFARDAVEWTRASEGWGMYARIYWYAAQSQYGDRLFTNSWVEWPDMKKGIDDVLNQYADDWNLANFARFSCLMGDVEKTKELIGRMNEAASWLVWEDHRDYQRCKDTGRAS